MPFYNDHENDFDSESPVLKSEAARREAARNVASTLFNEIDQPKMIVQTIDPVSGLPVSQTLVEGGIEYFNRAETGIEEPSQYNIASILNGNVSVREMMSFQNTASGAATSSGTFPQPAGQTEFPDVPEIAQEGDIDERLDRLGLDFLRVIPTAPSRLVQIHCSGLVTFQVPFPCHKIIQTESLIILVTDKRSTPSFQEMDFQLDRNAVETALIIPDLGRLPVFPPVPRTVSFEIGVLRCTVFVRRLSGNDMPNCGNER
jgi:hypothetical protein